MGKDLALGKGLALAPGVGAEKAPNLIASPEAGGEGIRGEDSPQGVPTGVLSGV